MELNNEDLGSRSRKLELQESQKYNFTAARISALESLLLDVYAALRPTKIEYEHRRNLVHIIDIVAKEAHGCSGDFPVVEAFGSFVMDMFTAKSDLDLSLNFSADKTSSVTRQKQISVLRKLAKILHAQQRKKKVSGVFPILRARVPVVKVVHCGTGVECDISVENKDGISRSLIINLICLVDERFRMLSFLMKVWAKACDINSAKDQTLSSLSIILLVAFHLQTRDPPILPPFSAFLRDGQDPISVQNAVHGFKDFGRANKESVAELFLTLLSKLSSVRSLWELGLCASTSDGCWISRTWKTSNIGVEDFLDQSQNCARAVGKEELKKIYSSIDNSLSHLVQFMNGQVEGSELKILLFGPVSLHVRDKIVVLNESGRPKKMGKKRRPKKTGKKRKLPAHESVVAPNINKRIRNTEPKARPDKHYIQIPSDTTFHPKHVVPSYHQSIPRQFNYEVQNYLKPSTETYNLAYYKPQIPLLSPAFACGPQHLPGQLFNTCQFGYGSHEPSPLVAPRLAYGSELYPPLPLVPLGLQSGHQTQPSILPHELPYRPFHVSQPPLSQSFHPGDGIRSICPMPFVDGRQTTVQFGYHNQHPGPQSHPFYRG